ncbi:protein CHROMATIN REMODELING [Trifolium repens]|nr:protein CHROMATIN REMODELING [Trifolium repens]
MDEIIERDEKVEEKIDAELSNELLSAFKVANFCNDEDDASFWSCWIKPDATFQAKIVWSAGSVNFWQWRMLFCCCQVAIVVVQVVRMACFPLAVLYGAIRVGLLVSLFALVSCRTVFLLVQHL